MSQFGAKMDVPASTVGVKPKVLPRPHNIRIIEWEMLDKKKFFPLSMMSSFTVRCFLYPLTLIRTRLQVKVFVFHLFIIVENASCRFNIKMQCTKELLMPTNKFHGQKV